MTRRRPPSPLGARVGLALGRAGPEEGAPVPLRDPLRAAFPESPAGPAAAARRDAGSGAAAAADPGAERSAGRGLRAAPGERLPALGRRRRPSAELGPFLQQDALHVFRLRAERVPALRPGGLGALELHGGARGPVAHASRRPDAPGSRPAVPAARTLPLGPDGAEADYAEGQHFPSHPSEYSGSHHAGLPGLGLLPGGRQRNLAVERGARGGSPGPPAGQQQRGLDLPGAADAAGRPPERREIHLLRAAPQLGCAPHRRMDPRDPLGALDQDRGLRGHAGCGDGLPDGWPGFLEAVKAPRIRPPGGLQLPRRRSVAFGLFPPPIPAARPPSPAGGQKISSWGGVSQDAPPQP